MVGSYIAERLSNAGESVVNVSRRRRIGWLQADLADHRTLVLPPANTIFCAANPRTFAKAIPQILDARPRRVVVFSSSSVSTKLDSKDEGERHEIEELIVAENQIMAACGSAGVEWTILRPTLIYKEGRDRNITQIAEIIRKLRFMPLYGSASGLRQPVHAEDLALGAIAASHSSAAANRTYFTSGPTLTYREMVGRIFDALSMPRRMVSLPPVLWQSAFAVARPFYPGITPAMGERMLKNMAFDTSPAAGDFGWSPRAFLPCFK